MQKKQTHEFHPYELTKVFKRKKTVRTTFNLKLSTLEKITWISKDYGWKANDVFKNALVTFELKVAYDIMGELLERTIDLIINNHKKTETDKRQRKTFLIEKDVLSFVNEISNKYKDKISRDIIIDFSIAQFTASLKKEEEREKEKNQKALKIVEELENLANDVYTQIETLYKEADNPVVKRVSYIFGLTEGLRQDIEDAINKGIPVELY